MQKLIFFLLPFFLFAQPQELDIQKGGASIYAHEKHVHIENTPNAILHWQDFSIGKEESVHFAQEHTKSIVLNRVTSNQCSHLLGRLTSNGTVFLINPNGVLIGAEAHIQTAGFLASTADISNENFVNSYYLFSRPGEGQVVNHGKVTCTQGDIYLIAKNIENTGILKAENVSLLSAYEVLITPSSNKKVAVRLELEDCEIASLIRDLDTTNPYEKAINHTGIIEASEMEEKNGRIYLCAQKREANIIGSLLVKSGEIQVLGESIQLSETAKLDVSGSIGGAVLIGGDYQGKNSEIMNAKTVIVEKQVSVNADGYRGNGGRVIFWGNEAMHFKGEVSAQALGERGDGGFVEISSPGNYHYGGLVKTLSKSGKVGKLLLDPADIIIGNFAGVSTPALMTPTYMPNSTANVDVTDLQTTLGSSSIDLNTGGIAVDLGTVTFNLGPTWSAVTTLTVTADRNILVNGGATISNTSASTGFDAIVFNANTAGVASGTFTGIDMIGDLVTDGGNINLTTIGGDTGNSNNGLRVQSAGSIIAGSSGGGGTITIDATGTTGGLDNNYGITLGSGINISSVGNLTITNATGSSAANAGGGNVGIRMSSVSNGRIVTDSGNLTVNATGASQATGDGNMGIQLTGTLGNNSFESIDSNTGDITITAIGAPLGGSGNIGVQLADPSNNGNNNRLIQTAGAIHIIATGAEFGTGGNNRGVDLIRLGKIESTGSTVDIVAYGDGLGSDCRGIQMSGGAATCFIKSINQMNITVIGSRSSVAGGGHMGIRVIGVANGGFSNDSGDITINATGAPQATGDGNMGILLTGSLSSNTFESIDSNTGDITIIAIGAPCGGSNNRGIQLADTSNNGSNDRRIRTAGAIDITATGAEFGTGGNNIGVDLTGRLGKIESTGSTVDIVAYGDGLGSNCIGINVGGGDTVAFIRSADQMNLTAIGSRNSVTGGGHKGIHMPFVGNGGISTDFGDLTINATGGFLATGDGNMGIQLTGTIPNNNLDEFIESNTGNITITAIGAPPGGSGNRGIQLVDTSAVNINERRIRTAGAIDITATATEIESGGNNIGVDIGRHGKIESTGVTSTSTVTINATSRGNSGSNRGVSLTSNALIQSVGGDLTVQGSCVAASGTDNPGIFMNSGSAQILSQDGSISLTGNGGFNSPGIHVTAGTINTTGVGSIACTGIGESQGIFLTGAASSVTASNSSITLTGTGGGAGTDADGIQILSSATITTAGSGEVTLAGTGSTTGGGDSRGVRISGSVLLQSDTGNITLNGTGGGNGTDNHGLEVSAGADITSTSGNIRGILRGGDGVSDDYGILVNGNGTTISSDTGGIDLTGTAGGATLEGINISILSPGFVEATTSGILQLTTPNNLFVGSGGVVKSQGTATMLLRAGVDTFLDTGSVVTTNTGNLTLVADNNFPTPLSGFGPGAFILQAGGSLTSGEELRIYTATQSQNTVNETVNGVIFIPGPFDVDTSTEEWSIYFPGGSYGGAVFKFYYKNSGASSVTQRELFENIASNLVALDDLLPILRLKRAPEVFPNYHFKVCEQDKECSPHFFSYESFIFEDDVWWIGESF